MRVTRRDFLKWAGLASMGAVACNVFREGEMEIQSPLQLPEDLVTGQDNWYATLCCQCPEREGVLVRVMEGRAKKVRGNPLYPTNQGKQSARCEGGLQALYHPDRLAAPMLHVGPRGSGEFQQIGWTEAMDRLLMELRNNDPNSMLMITEPLRGHLGMVVNRFVETYGGRHLAFEPLENTVLRVAVKRVFGQDILPDFDIENTGYLLSFGADFLSTWVSPVRYSHGYGEFRGTRDGKERGVFVHVDARYSMTAANADQWIPITPGREGILALGIAHVIISEDLADPSVVQAMSSGAGKEALLSALDDFKPENIIRSDNPLYIGIPETIREKHAGDIIREIAREFAAQRRGPSLAIGGGQAGAHTNGLFNLSAIFSLNFLVGSVGRSPGEGGIVFNPPPPIAGIPAASIAGSPSDWTKVVDDLRDGGIRVLMVRGANPVHGLPDAAGFRETLGSSGPFVVSFSSFMDDTAQMADLVLPERSYLEDWGDDVPEPGPGYQVIGIQQPVVNPLTDLDPRSFPDILLTLSQDLGLDDGLPNTFRDVLREGARELHGLNRGSVSAPTFEAFWNALLQRGGWWDVNRVSGDSSPPPPNLVELVGQAGDRRLPSFRAPDDGDTFYLIPFLSNSLLDGRGAHLPWLQAAPDPLTTVTWQTWIEINPRVAERMGLKEADVVRVVSTEGSIEAIVYPHPAVPPDVVSIPVGQGHTPGLQYATKDGEQRGANPISILAPVFDNETNALAWAATRVRVEPTGRSTVISKFEGIVPAFPIGTRGEDVVQVTRG